MKVEFESVLFGAALLVLVIISLPGKEADSEDNVAPAAAEQVETSAADDVLKS
ncbi:hypothetical protein [Hyphococcus luteus]|uniref:hypothetical protein n=1 Tax=Hyphococcus luteus TaxID=2058213 RepID=UPI0013FE4EC0|nr:hypothetical protein [Marinicaulis flavus]